MTILKYLIAGLIISPPVEAGEAPEEGYYSPWQIFIEKRQHPPDSSARYIFPGQFVIK